MNHSEYTDEIKRTAPNLGNDFIDQLHMVVGISTEAGELLDVFKKALAYGKPLDVVHLREEFGDLFWYTFNLMRMLGIDFETTLQINVEKLYARYPKGFSQADALERNLENERTILSGNSQISPITEEELQEFMKDS